MLKVKNFLEKNAKLAEKWKGPFVITKVHANNTVTIKYPSGKKEYLYNTEILKKFKEAKEEQENRKKHPRFKLKSKKE